MKTARTAARARVAETRGPAQMLAALAFGLILALAAATLTRAEEALIKAHGFAEFGELKYAPGFAHFDYVNPQAPKGGELSISAVGTFRVPSLSFNRLICSPWSRPLSSRSSR